ncbi:unnamed protein product [Nesidiocoris tenuis]|uniref:Uncharacterized protein n=1 Tax=Nesidiocoris tenuis TaxID=355587 RepID=A0A6H5G6K8_9HEMI|nr:unnamed protein product [Nesidiocoris tenuis]
MFVSARPNTLFNRNSDNAQIKIMPDHDVPTRSFLPFSGNVNKLDWHDLMRTQKFRYESMTIGMTIFTNCSSSST